MVPDVHPWGRSVVGDRPFELDFTIGIVRQHEQLRESLRIERNITVERHQIATCHVSINSNVGPSEAGTYLVTQRTLFYRGEPEPGLFADVTMIP
ncbi:hypothetical protein [Paraburkholderia graminis]|uniref:hypothetical protein n=1 Tax=Paraburkholderia graminis TaxID=60548 RepID=UPI002792726E|nr:hypothetical protein [Paraburkholderia graminis]MDQ0627095.1 hypothetical protein [Paraburkholderia graminis]